MPGIASIGGHAPPRGVPARRLAVKTSKVAFEANPSLRPSVSIGMDRSLLCLVPSAWMRSYRAFCSVPTLSHVPSIADLLYDVMVNGTDV
jgi:hypothetical protein